MQGTVVKNFRIRHKRMDTHTPKSVQERIKNTVHLPTIEANCEYARASFCCDDLENVISPRRMLDHHKYLSVGLVFINFHFPGLISIVGRQTSTYFTLDPFPSALQLIGLFTV